MKLFVGLGNPGSEYAGNRHNVGFMAVDAIAASHGFGPWKKKFQGLAADGEIAGERVLLLKPQTYMNESGRSVGDAARFLKIGLADTVVFYDEIDLAPGKIKVKTGGGNAGHNGLRSISQHVGNDYQRVRIGVGHPGDKDLVAHYVLSNFAKADQSWLQPLIAAISAAAPRLVRADQARFLSDIAKELQRERPSGSGSSPLVSSAQDGGQTKRAAAIRGQDGPQESGEGQQDGDDLKRGPTNRHPSGERATKRKNALAENLSKWLAARKGQD